MKYRRHNGSDVWHWCTNCEDWPKTPGTFEEVDLPAGQRPTSGELDNECRSKEDDGNCSTAN
jgi:hypothetical protein